MVRLCQVALHDAACTHHAHTHTHMLMHTRRFTTYVWNGEALTNGLYMVVGCTYLYLIFKTCLRVHYRQMWLYIRILGASQKRKNLRCWGGSIDTPHKSHTFVHWWRLLLQRLHALQSASSWSLPSPPRTYLPLVDKHTVKQAFTVWNQLWKGYHTYGNRTTMGNSHGHSSLMTWQPLLITIR